MASLLGVKICRSISKSNSVIRTASGCSPNNSSHVFQRPRSLARRVSRTQQRSSAGLRSFSQPKELAALSRCGPSVGGYATTTRRDEDYAEHEEVEDEVPAQTEPDAEQAEEEAPGYASFVPYFKRSTQDQFKEPEDVDADQLNTQARRKYTKAVVSKDQPSDETTLYRLEIARPRNEDADDYPVFNVADTYREQYNVREKTFFAHLQPSNMRPFGSYDSLFFPLKSAKPNYDIFKKYGEKSEPQESPDEAHFETRGGSSQHREYSTISGKGRHHTKPKEKTQREVKDYAKPSQTKDYSTVHSKKAETDIRSSRALKQSHWWQKSLLSSRRKTEHDKLDEPHEACKTFSKCHTSTQMPSSKGHKFWKQSELKPDVNLKQKRRAGSGRASKIDAKETIDNRLLQDRVLPASALDKDAKKPFPNENDTISVDATPPKPSVLKRAPSKLNVLQTSALPEDAALMDSLKRKDNERFIPPWPSYSETVQKAKSPVSSIIYPLEVLPKPLTPKKSAVKADVTQAREFSTGHARKKFSKKVTRNECKDLINKNGFYRPCRGLGSHRKSFRPNTFACPPKSRHPFSTKRASEKSCPKAAKEPEKLCGVDEDDETTKIAGDDIKAQDKKVKSDPPPCRKPVPNPVGPCPPLVRLKKKKVEPKKRVCKKKRDVCVPRADDGLKVEQKKLPEITPGVCKPEELKMKDCAPLPRLKKANIPEPPRCKVESVGICAERSDGDLKVEQKALPPLKPQTCPVPGPPKMTDVKLYRLKKVPVAEPPKICPKKEQCPQRADDALVIHKKELPDLKPVDCPKPQSRKYTDPPSLQRLKKVQIKEPPKICPTKKTCPMRADEGLEVTSKALPRLKPAGCSQPSSPPMKDCAALKRLPKNNISEPPKICPPKEKCPERADDGVKIEAKPLPEYKPFDCPKPLKEPMRDCSALKRLPQKLVSEPPKICPQREKCPDRADQGIAISAKNLPKLVSAPGCPPEPIALKDCKPLARLEKKTIPEPKRCVIIKKVCTTERADGNLATKQKELPPLEAPDCPQVPPHPMRDVCLPRLKKVVVAEPKKVCKKKGSICYRADGKIKVKQKKLPVLTPMDCPQASPKKLRDSPPLTRLEKVFIPEPPKVCKKKDKECVERADVCLKVEPRILPVLEPPPCILPPANPMKEGSPLPRLPKISIDSSQCKKQRKEVCPPRADQSLKVTTKPLPILKPAGCCKPTPMKLKDCKPLKKLQKVVIPEPKRCVIVKEKCSVERADKNFAIEKKQLPQLPNPDCPKVEPEPMKDVVLPRLKKVTVLEPPKICPVAEQCPERADEVSGYKIKQKPLQTIILTEEHNDIGYKNFKSSKKTKKGTFSSKRSYSRSVSTTRTGHVLCIPKTSFHGRRYNTLLGRLRLLKLEEAKNALRETQPGNSGPVKNYPYRENRNCFASDCKCKPKKTVWDKICDYFRARPGCPPPDEWKKERLRKKAEKAAKAAGLYVCECPCTKKIKIRKKPPVCAPKPKKDPCPKFRMPFCRETQRSGCDGGAAPIECNAPREAPYPSFSEYQREARARRMNECTAADVKWEKEKGNIGMKKAKRKAKVRCFSTSNKLVVGRKTRNDRAARIIGELDRELKRQTIFSFNEDC